MNINKDLKGIVVLLVEDDAFNQRFIKRLLENLQGKVYLASNGKEAIDLPELNEVDIILMDLQMPVMDGFETIQHIRQKLALATPILALTGSEFAADKEKALDLGCKGYLVKPLNSDTLLTAIRRGLETGVMDSIEEKEEKKTVKSKALYSLSKLEEISRGNQEFVKKMVNMLVEEMPISLAALKEGLEHKDYDQVRAMAHKMKPSIQLMNMSRISKTIQTLEDNAKAKTNLEQIPDMVHQVMDVCERVLEELRGGE